MHLRAIRFAAILLFSASFVWFSLAANRDANRTAQGTEFYFHHDHVIGTSLDVWLTANSGSDAELAEAAILNEIERLRKIFSLYDDTSELSRLNRTREPMVVSTEMLEVLRLYEYHQDRSHGAFNGQLGSVIQAWKDAERTQRLPDEATLSRLANEIRTRGWRIDEVNRTVTRITHQPLNLNAIAKGFIIQKAAAAALAKVESMTGMLLNLGGDMFAWGLGDTVGVQDPRQPQDNAPMIAHVRLHNQAIATSGGYERYYTIQGNRYSHLFDPRTARPADAALSATVIARDNVIANALATTLCALAPADGLRLIANTPGTACLLVLKDGSMLRSAGFAAIESPRPKFESPVALQDKDKVNAWPDGYQVNFTITLPTIVAKKYRRPYVALWLEDADGKPVRTVTVWGNNPRWIKDLPQWWRFAKNDGTLVKSVSRATRVPGKYSVVWDGKDDNGTSLPRGTYTVWVEVHREHGKLVRQTGKLTCGAEPVNLTLAANAETGATLVDYAKNK